MPHQLEPALAVIRGRGSRLLLADDVGLGKTIQAGLIVSELLARNAIDRVLILTPAGLREQWEQELARRFAIAAAAVDGRVLRRLATTLPIGVNPWSTLAACRRVGRLRQAAGSAAGGRRLPVGHRRRRRGARRGRRLGPACGRSHARVARLVCPPPDGDASQRRSARVRGAVRPREADAPDDPPLLVFRRTRHDVGTGTIRRVHVVQVRQSADELRMHALLGSIQ